MLNNFFLIRYIQNINKLQSTDHDKLIFNFLQKVYIWSYDIGRFQILEVLANDAEIGYLYYTSWDMDIPRIGSSLDH